MEQQTETGRSDPSEQDLDPGVELINRLDAAEGRVAELQDAYLRAQADAENARRRSQEDVARAQKFAIEQFAEDLLPVKDNLARALQAQSPSIDVLREGVDMTLKQLTAAFERHRLVEIDPTPGDRLDPEKHHAISMMPADQEANTIVSVLQKGYMIADRLLRPALVTVAQAAQSRRDDQSTAKGDSNGQNHRH